MCFHDQHVLYLYPVYVCLWVLVFFHAASITQASFNTLLFPTVPFHFLLLLSLKQNVFNHIDLFAGDWMHLGQQQGSIHILACSLWFLTVHNGGGMTQNTAEVRILP